MEDKVAKRSEIKFDIELNENNVPLNIKWSASDNGDVGDCNAIMLSLWDKKEKNSLRIDLWTKEMMVDEMKHFVHQTIITMADSLERATGEKDMAEDMRRFSEYYADQMKIEKPID